MNSNLIEHFLSKKQVENLDFFLIQNVNCDNIFEVFNCIFKCDWAYEILKIERDQESYVYIIVSVYVPGKVITSMVCENDELQVLLNKALKKALIDYSAGSNDINKIKEEKSASEDKAPANETNLDELENSIKNKAPKNEYGIRQDQISFINDFKAKYSIDSDEKFNHYIQTWSDNNIYEINTKKELVLAGEKVIDEFIKWITIASANDTITNSIVSPL